MNLTLSIDNELKKILPSEKKNPISLHRAMRYCVFPAGKRIRPVILVEAASACGANLTKSAAAACAVELVHSYSLVHDDLPSMDNDDYRRGKPSCHKKFGEAAAILAGDSLLTLAFNVLGREYRSAIGSRLAEELSRAIGSLGMAGGQALDIERSRKRSSSKSLPVDEINLLKTAKLFEASAAMGAILARAKEKEVSAMRSYGLNLGIAFQSVDDILDKEFGKHSREAKNSMVTAVKSIRKAKASLGIFGKRGLRLSQIADSVLARLGAE